MADQIDLLGAGLGQDLVDECCDDRGGVFDVFHAADARILRLFAVGEAVGAEGVVGFEPVTQGFEVVVFVAEQAMDQDDGSGAPGDG